MIRIAAATFLLALAGCAGVAPPARVASPCVEAEASYACQVQRYYDVAAQ